MNTNLTKKDKTLIISTCISPFCFFCAMKEPNSQKRRSQITNCFKQMRISNEHENVLVLSSVFHIAMSKPDDPEFPSLGIFDCMASLINRGLEDEEWLRRGQNIYIPYYAAHIIGSYTMNKADFAERAVKSGVIAPLMEILRGKNKTKKMTSWVEKRVAIRALGHLASYETTFEAVAKYEKELVSLASDLASSCVDVVYDKFVGVKDKKGRPKYQCDLLTRGVKSSLEMENLKAEEWTSQIQCWSLYLLNCFAYKERSLNLICNSEFLKRLCGMWGGLANHVSPTWVGLVRILCYSKYGRKKVAEVKEVIESLSNLSRSSDDWQYMSIDCLLLLLKDQQTRCKVIDISVLYLADLVELKDLRDRSNLGDSISRVLLQDHNKQNKNIKVQIELEALWEWKFEKRRKERLLSEEKLEERRVLVSLIKHQAKRLCSLGDIKEALKKYSEAIELCPLKFRRERMVIYSNMAQCELALGDPDSAIRDSTRALCLSNPANSHSKSLWTRSQAYDFKGLAKESLMDCIMFINGCNYSIADDRNRSAKIPYHAARMISKQMDATWLFAAARSRNNNIMSNKGLSTIKEEPLNMVIKDEINMIKTQERGERIFKRPHNPVVKRQMKTSETHFEDEILCGGFKSDEHYSKFSVSDVYD